MNMYFVKLGTLLLSSYLKIAIASLLTMLGQLLINWTNQLHNDIQKSKKTTFLIELSGWMGGESKGLETKEEQVTRGHNIVADEWAGAANPLPNTDTFTKSFQNTRFPTFRLVLMD